MTITTKENANGRISGYYVDGVKVRKNEIDSIINARRDEIIYVDYYTGQEFKMLTRSFNRQLKVIFTGYSETIMTQAAADELDYNVIRNWTGTTYSNACLVEKKNDAETDGSEDDPDDNSEFSKYLPAIDELNDVDTTQTKDEMKAAADQMGLMQLNRKIADLEEQLIDNRLAATAVLDEITNETTLAEQKDIERRYSKHAAISDALIDERAIYKAAKSTRLSQIAAIKNLMSKKQNTSSTKEPPALDLDDNEFTFPTVDELNDTANGELNNSASTIDELKTKRDRLYRHKALLTKAEFEHMERKLNAAIGQRAEPQKTAEETPLTKEQIEKLMGAIVQEREEFYDALEEAEADEEIAQSHIDYLKGEIERLGNEYYELWAQLVKLKAAEKNVAETESTELDAKVICERVRNVRRRGLNHVVTCKGRHMWYCRGSLISKDIVTIILAKEKFTIEEYIEAEKFAEDYWWEVEFPRMLAISNQATFLEDKHWREVKPYDEELTANVMPPEVDDSDDELVDPPDKADIYDSLARAMKIALLKYQDFCREYNLKAAQNELSLFNICSNAMRELSEAVA